MSLNVRHALKELNDRVDKLGGAPGLSNEVKEIKSRLKSVEDDVFGIKQTLADMLDKLDNLDKPAKAPAKKAKAPAKKAKAEDS